MSVPQVPGQLFSVGRRALLPQVVPGRGRREASVGRACKHAVTRQHPGCQKTALSRGGVKTGTRPEQDPCEPHDPASRGGDASSGLPPPKGVQYHSLHKSVMSPYSLSVASDPRIGVLHEELRRVKGSAFEVVVAPE